MKPIPKGKFSRVLESSALSRDSLLTELVNGRKVDQAAQMAYSILSAVEKADLDTYNKLKVRSLPSHSFFPYMNSWVFSFSFYTLYWFTQAKTETQFLWGTVSLSLTPTLSITTVLTINPKP